MSTLLVRTLTRLTFTACALLVLAAFGQPIESPKLAPARVLAEIDGVPLAARFLKVVGDETAENAACDVEPINTKAVDEAAAAALARSALRMRWLLTSPSASNRGCVASGCTG